MILGTKDSDFPEPPGYVLYKTDLRPSYVLDGSRILYGIKAVCPHCHTKYRGSVVGEDTEDEDYLEILGDMCLAGFYRQHLGSDQQALPGITPPDRGYLKTRCAALVIDSPGAEQQTPRSSED